MAENKTVYENAVTTHRTGDFLAGRHGFESVRTLAESLPQNARVLDVGAGASPFGAEVAAIRPDITWVNLDYSYQDPEILAEVTKDAPANVQHVFGDATKLSEQYESESFDAVFSYWLLPHMSIDAPEPAKDAAKGIFSVTKQGGLMSVGPKFGKHFRPTLKPPKAAQFIKDESLGADQFAETVFGYTRLRKISRFVQKLANEVATPFFGTSRYTRMESGKLKVFHPETEEYISPMSRKAVKTAGKLAVAASKHVYRQSKKTAASKAARQKARGE